MIDSSFLMAGLASVGIDKLIKYRLKKQIYCGLIILLHPSICTKRPLTSRKTPPLIRIPASLGGLLSVTSHKTSPVYHNCGLTILMFALDIPLALLANTSVL